MSRTGQTVAKNASFLMVSQVITWVLAMLLTLFLPRILGAEGVGQLHLADSLWAIVGIFLAFGMDTYLTKVIARNPERTGELLGVSSVLRAILFAFGFIGVVIYTKIAGYAPVTSLVIFIYGAGTLVGQLGSATLATLVGLERMEFVAIANVASRLTSTVVVIAVLLAGYGVVAAATIFAIASLVSLIIQYYFLRRLQPLRFSFNFELARAMLKASLPYMFVMVFSVMYMNLDAIVISLQVNEETLGWYSGADRLFGTLMFVPSVFMTVVFPTLSRLNTESPEEMRKLMRRSFNMLLVIGVPIGLGILCVANNVVVLIFGESFAPSGPVLAILGVVLIFTYQNILLGQFLIAVDRQNIWTVVMAVATAATIPLDLFFIPLMNRQFGNGALGGALSFVVTEIFMTIVGLHYLPQGVLNRHNYWVAGKILFAGFIMAAVVWPLRNLFVAIPITVGGIVYIGLILLFQVITDEDKTMMINQGLRIWQRIIGRRSRSVGI